MEIGYYIVFHGVSLTMSFNIEIHDLSILVLTQKVKMNVSLPCKLPCHLVIDIFLLV